MSRLEVQHLSVQFGNGASAVRALDDVSLEVESGTVVGVVGESGSGKSTLARVIAGMQPVDAGRVLLDGRDIIARRGMSPGERAKLVQMIFQDPHSSLNPKMTVEECLDEVLAVHTTKTRRERAASIGELLSLVRLKPEARRQYPSQLSGGMRQRVAIARCLAVRPSFIIADEITSALDASVQGAVINLMRELQAELNLSVLFITHNLAVVRYVADRTAVMRSGQLVEVGNSVELVSNPQHPYTQNLISAIPNLADAGTDPLLGDIAPITTGIRVGTNQTQSAQRRGLFRIGARG
ncbi:ABC transporter ATP-binding protein [Microbacterium sp. NPDC077663]|uniref:ABC transporter ATP-binding protein n=1 Tax=Microbacterium sp. NPDC077663 TaxID=3364189 RepID=UPI0037C5FC3C